jgi:hypothetical protein
VYRQLAKTVLAHKWRFVIRNCFIKYKAMKEYAGVEVDHHEITSDRSAVRDPLHAQSLNCYVQLKKKSGRESQEA